MKKRINKIKCPALIIQGDKDITINKNSADIIYGKISSEIKNKWIIEGATHILMQESCKDELFEKSLNFIHKSISYKS